MPDGYIYVAQNEFHPADILKIGFTEREPPVRMEELSGHTGVVGTYRLQFCISAKDVEGLENKIHARLSEHRVSRSREFFKMSVSAAIQAAIREWIEGKHIFHLAPQREKRTIDQSRRMAENEIEGFYTAIDGLGRFGLSYSEQPHGIWDPQVFTQDQLSQLKCTACYRPANFITSLRPTLKKCKSCGEHFISWYDEDTNLLHLKRVIAAA